MSDPVQVNKAHLPMRTVRRIWPPITAALFLGFLTTWAVALSSAFFFPANTSRFGVTEKDGDHLQLWILRTDLLTGSRMIWFEKGRIYGKQPPVGPQNGSSSAIACWSFATATRSSGLRPYAKGTVELPPEERERITQTPAKVWGVAIDRRGWPLPALEGRAVGTMDANSPTPYVAEVGYLLRPETKAFGLAAQQQTFASSESLADLRIIPTRPLWPGLIINTLLMSAAWWVLFTIGAAGLNALPSRSRARRGLCIHCGYDLAGLDSPTCPECGKPRSAPPSPPSDDAS
jgi:hypothetical protein